MSLSHEQIECLFEFTKKQGVIYYDVQVELVDHLATKIEEDLEQDETLAFAEALRRAFDSFGVIGFEDVLKEREWAAADEEHNMLFDELKQWATFQRISLLLCIGLIAYFFGTYFNPGVAIWLVMAATIIFHVYSICFLAARKAEKQLVLLQCTTYSFLFAPFSPLPLFLTIEVSRRLESKPVEIIAGVVLLYSVLLITVCNVRRRLRKRAKTLYPEAFA